MPDKLAALLEAVAQLGPISTYRSVIDPILEAAAEVRKGMGEPVACSALWVSDVTGLLQRCACCGTFKAEPVHTDDCHLRSPLYSIPPDCVERGEYEKVKTELAVTDKLLNERNRLLALFDCPEHGSGCVPNAIEQVGRMIPRAKVSRLARAAHHREGCKGAEFGTCTCGLSAALAGVEGR